jgi:hypothetical protein
MITIFGDFSQFLAKKWCLSQKTNAMIKYVFAKSGSGLSKNANIFVKFFGENILRIVTSVPRPRVSAILFFVTAFL